MITNAVTTVFSAVTSPFTGPVSLMANVAKGTRDSLLRLSEAVNPLTVALGGLASGATLSGIVALNSQFEQTRLTMGGMLTAIGRAGDIDQGFRLAEQTMISITNAAAALPGEAEDYIQVFRAGLVQVDSALQGTLAQSVQFTNQITAIGRTFGIDAIQIGMDVKRMLASGRGSAGMDVRTFQELLPYMKQIEGQANITTESFNRMTAPERAQLLQQTFAQLQPMLDRAGTTWDAMAGAMMSSLKMIGRQASAPIFDALKDALGEMNALLYDGNGVIQQTGIELFAFGRTLSRNIVGGFREAWQFATYLYGQVKQVTDAITASPGFQAIVGALSNAGSALAQLKTGIEGAFSGAVGGTSGVMDRLMGAFNTVGEMIFRASAVLSPFVGYLSAMAGLVVDLASNMLPGVLEGLNAITAPLFEFAGYLFDVGAGIATNLRPTMQRLYTAVGDLASQFGQMFGPTLRLIIAVMKVLGEIIGGYLMPKIRAVYDALGYFIQGIADFLKWLRDTLHIEGLSSINFGGGGGGFISRVMEQYQRDQGQIFADSVISQVQATAQDQQRMAQDRERNQPRPGGHTVQDFRNSRFTIDQKFAEGFDPDRVAVAFRQDLERIGTLQGQSGLAPLFGIGG